MEGKKRSKGKLITILLIIFCFIGVLCYAGYFLYHQANRGVYFKKTTINGFDASEKTPGDVLDVLVKEYSAPKVTLLEQGETALELSLSDMGYEIDDQLLLATLDACMDDQNANLLPSLMDGNAFRVKVPFSFDEEKFTKAVTASAFANARVKSQDASLEYDKRKNEYYIVPEVNGTELDDADVRTMVKDLVDRIAASEDPQGDASLEIPESFYFTPDITSKNAKLNHDMNQFNSYCKTKITLTFGSKSEKLDWSTIQNWLVFTDEDVLIDDEPVYNYVYDLAARYDTLYYPREFTAHDGRVIQYASSDYGYQIDIDGEAQQLMADVNSNTRIKRDPVYAVKGYTRDGRDDLAGNYVEVNLSAQHLWFYKDGNLVTETDVVSGLPKNGRETVTGVYTIPYKKYKETLKGSNWSTDVDYWMPFYDGQGLHDAPWRSSFGGNIYQSNGSHGCVNLPYGQAQLIFENMEERFPIFLYK